MEIEDNIVVFRWNSMKFYKTVFNLIILTLYLFFLMFQYVKSMYEGKGIVLLVIVSIWEVKTLITILVLFICIYKRNQFQFFFQSSENMKVKLVGFVNCQLAVDYSRKFYKFYVFLAIVSGVFCLWQALLEPNAIYSVACYVTEPTAGMIFLNCVFQIYLHFITQAAFSFIEVLCPSLARSTYGSIERIRDEMTKAVKKSTFQWNEQNLDMDKTISATIFEKQDKAAALQLTMYPTVEAENGKRNGVSGTEPIMKALERFHLITEKQGLINCIFGPILALNTAWLVINVCLLLFLEIRYLNPASGKTGDNLEERVNLFITLLIIWNACTVTIRLLIVLLSLGRVYHASKYFDISIMNALIDIPKPHKQLDLQLIQTHLISHGATPLAFSAGGYFVFSRGTILYVISIVTTYLVFLLQA